MHNTRKNFFKNQMHTTKSPADNTCKNCKQATNTMTTNTEFTDKTSAY